MATKNTHSKQRTKFDNVKEAVSQVKNLGDKEITVFVGKGTAKTNEPFVILFYQSFIRLVVNQQLTLTDLKVMLAILDFVSLGNVVHLTHQEIAERIEILRRIRFAQHHGMPQILHRFIVISYMKIVLPQPHQGIRLVLSHGVSSFLNFLFILPRSLRKEEEK